MLPLKRMKPRFEMSYTSVHGIFTRWGCSTSERCRCSIGGGEMNLPLIIDHRQLFGSVPGRTAAWMKLQTAAASRSRLHQECP
jgi:hypothetical protein